MGAGTEEDPRDYVSFLSHVFADLLPKLADDGILWINIGDAYNTPVNWREHDSRYSSLGPDGNGLPEHNTAYTKPRASRKAFLDVSVPWLRYGNLLALGYRLVVGLCDHGYLFRGEVIWHKRNPMPEGRCRRPHRQHEPVYLLAKKEAHRFRIAPPVGTVWEFANEQLEGRPHFSRFPLELPLRCIEALGDLGPHVVVLDPFSGSGTTGLAARRLNCTYIGFEIDPEQVQASNERLRSNHIHELPLLAR
jgi:DNA modification methylase